MATELIGQKTTGTPMSERDCFQRAMYHIAGLRDCLRGIALLRGDIRWLVPVRAMEQMEDTVKKLIDRPGRSSLILPRGAHH